MTTTEPKPSQPGVASPENDGQCPRCNANILLGRMRHHLTWCEGPDHHTRKAWEAIERQNEQIRAMRAALEGCERVFLGWLHDADPHGDLKDGESADRDAALSMLSSVRSAIAGAKGAK